MMMYDLRINCNNDIRLFDGRYMYIFHASQTEIPRLCDYIASTSGWGGMRRSLGCAQTIMISVRDSAPPVLWR